MSRHFRFNPLNCIITFFIFIFVILAIVVVIVAVNNSTMYTSTLRYCVTSENNIFHPDTNSTIIGQVVISKKDKTIEWDLFLQEKNNNNTIITGIHINGPYTSTHPINPDLKVPLCGLPSSETCLTNAANGHYVGEINQVLPAGSSLINIISEIVDNPQLYFVSFKTNDFTDGAIKAHLTSLC